MLFFVALVLPLIIVTYLGFDTLTERHRTTKNILDSNLWITGESAIYQLEDELRNIELNILSKEHLQHLFVKESVDSFSHLLSVFLLQEDQSIAYPETGTAAIVELAPDKTSPSLFSSEFRLAEVQEFQYRNYIKAAEGYQSCFEIADSERNRAYALEGLGRTSLLQKKYSSASLYYELLLTQYSGIQNEVGHPYGIIGLLQLYETRKFLDEDGQLLSYFLDSYEKLKNGYWKLNSSSFAFFKSEIETALQADLLHSSDTHNGKVFDSLTSAPSPYLAKLELSAFLQKDAIRKIEELHFINIRGNDPQTQRIISQTDEGWSLISFRILSDFLDGENYTGGIKWNTDSLREVLIPTLLEGISSGLGLDLFLQEKTEAVSPTSGIPENSISLSFRSFPLPWKLIVVQPAILNIEKEIRKEMVIYGLMLGIVIILMTMGALLIARDIKREADATNMKTEFVHNVSHELKTPLSLIRLYGETLLIKDGLSTEEKTDALQVITKESERLSHMINNILDFSKIEIGRKEFNFRKGDMARTIEDTLDSYRYHLEKKGFQIVEDLAQNLPPITFDKEAVEGMMINLLSNAIKYSPGKKEITISLCREGGQIVLQVSDKGKGIASADVRHIFDRFYRSKEKTGSESSGSGLGLTLVKHIVDSHQGFIHVESESGKGSTFTIKFPILKSP